MPFSKEIAELFTQKNVFHTTRDGVRWYCVSELCEVFNFSNVTHCRRKAGKENITHIPHTSALSGGEHYMLFMKEDAMYRLILTSKQAGKPGTRAHKFLTEVSKKLVPVTSTDDDDGISGDRLLRGC